MSQELRAVLDACVLAPMPLADTLLRLAAARAYQPLWTSEIMTEVRRTLTGKFGLGANQVRYREGEIRRHFGGAWVRGYQELIPAMKNHPKDRHVLAAAVRAGADLIVTYNLRDFPDHALHECAVRPICPSSFLRRIWREDPARFDDAIDRQAKAMSKPTSYVLERLRVNAPSFVDEYRGNRAAALAAG